VPREKIADKARKASVPIWKWMNSNEAMAEPHGNFVRRIGVVLNPVARVVDGLLYVHGDPVRIDADIAGSRTILPRPTPYVAEHLPVQFAQNLPIENIAAARPLQRRAAPILLCSASFSSCRSVM